jgi:hypothetical protein
MLCDCVLKVSFDLSAEGAKLDTERRTVENQGSFDVPKLKVFLASDSKRDYLPDIPCLYCPFCGQKYPTNDT